MVMLVAASNTRCFASAENSDHNCNAFSLETLIDRCENLDACTVHFTSPAYLIFSSYRSLKISSGTSFSHLNLSPKQENFTFV